MYPNSFYKMKNFANPKTMFKSCINNDEQFSTEPVLPTNGNRMIRSSSLRTLTKSSGSPIGTIGPVGYPCATSTPDRRNCNNGGSTNMGCYATGRSSQPYFNAPSCSGTSNAAGCSVYSGTPSTGFGFVGGAGGCGGGGGSGGGGGGVGVGGVGGGGGGGGGVGGGGGGVGNSGGAGTGLTGAIDAGASPSPLSISRSHSSGSNTDDAMATTSMASGDGFLSDSYGGDAASEQPNGQQQEPSEPHHPLHSNWTLWYLENDRSKSWEDMLHEVTSFNTVENFWSLINHIKPPSEIKLGSDYCLFKKGIRPMWEDDANVHGGRWVINLNKNTQNDLDNFWLDTMLCLIGECCDYSDELCGAVVNIRGKSNKISIWTADGGNEAAALEIGNKLRESLRMESGYVLQYQLHKDTMVKQGSTVKSIYTL